jgi:hypothetical protein
MHFIGDTAAIALYAKIRRKPPVAIARSKGKTDAGGLRFFRHSQPGLPQNGVRIEGVHLHMSDALLGY